jgi:hypothetical protein
MSPTDVLWILPALAGVALGLRLRPPTLGLLLGFAFVVVSIGLFGYSIDHYPNGDCQAGAPCPTGEHIIEFVEPGAFILGSTLVLVAFGRTVWDYWSALRTWRRRRA